MNACVVFIPESMVRLNIFRSGNGHHIHVEVSGPDKEYELWKFDPDDAKTIGETLISLVAQIEADLE